MAAFFLFVLAVAGGVVVGNLVWENTTAAEVTVSAQIGLAVRTTVPQAIRAQRGPLPDTAYPPSTLYSGTPIAPPPSPSSKIDNMSSDQGQDRVSSRPNHWSSTPVSPPAGSAR